MRLKPFHWSRALAALQLASALAAFGSAAAQGIFAPLPLKDKEQTLIDTSRELHDYFAQRSLLFGDPSVVALVDRVGQSLAPAATDAYIDYRFFVLRDPSPNAFALPNGDVYVHTGMLARLADDAQLAAVLAHEVNHVAGHHSIVDSRANTKKIIAGMVLTGAFGGMGSLISAGLYTSMYGYSRELEQEADDHAVLVLHERQTFDAHALPEIYEILAADYEGVQPRVATIWSTHPQLEARAKRTREQVRDEPIGSRDLAGFDAVVLPLRAMTIRDYIQDDYPRTAIALATELAARYPTEPLYALLIGDGWQAMGARAEFDDELSNADKRRNATRRVTRTRQERERELLATPAGQAARASSLVKARAAYEQTLALDAGFAPAYRGLGEVAEAEQDPRAAARAYVDYLRRAPDADDKSVVLGRLRTLREVLRNEDATSAPTAGN